MTQHNATPSKTRWKLLIIIYFACLIAYLDRVNLSIVAKNVMEEMDFDKIQLGYTMSAFFTGYAVLQIPSSILGEKFGTRVVAALAILWWSVFTFLTPLAWGFTSFMIIRFMFGLGEAPIFPCIQTFFSRWFSFKEKAIANSGMLMGVFFAPAIGPWLTVQIVDNLSWRWAFYAYGFAGSIAALLWFIYARNTPQEHKDVNQGEIDAINIGRTQTQIDYLIKKEVAPWTSRFLKSPRFWLIGIQYFIANYIMYLFLSWIPTYLQEARHMTFQKMGISASVPWLCLTLSVLIGGFASDRLVSRNVSKVKSRSLFAIVGFAFCMFGLYMGAGAESDVGNLLWLSLSLGALGFSYIASWAGCQDLGGKFGGSVSAWMNTWGNLAGVAAPVVTAYLVRAFGWQGALSMTSVFIFIGCFCWVFIRPDRSLVEEME
ncbi:MAG: MFS transporter [Deltaproteobacteria bacterium]|jgi:ACS family glucarate transporter-like MFS transporter|nr:MFS transporter [Deltaproteobacteria bacterium]